MKLLFIKPKYIGDTLLITGTLRAVKQAMPDAEIWVAVREGTEGILAGSPDMDGVVTLSRPKAKGRLLHDLKALLRLRRLRFDTVFELGDGDRSRMIAFLSGARRKVANTHPVHMRSGFWRARFGDLVRRNYNTPGIPRAEWDFETVATALAIPTTDVTPIFVRDRADFTAIPVFADNRPVLFVHPAASTVAKMWPESKWSELLRGLIANFDIILSCGPSVSELAYCERILAGLPEASRVRFTGGKLSWPAMAGALYSSVAYIGADTAAMHLAGACHTPILGIFGHNSPEHLAQWTPRGDRVRIVTFSGAESGIADIPVARVREALDSLSLR